MLCESAAEAVAGIEDGSTVLIGGFGMAGMPVREARCSDSRIHRGNPTSAWSAAVASGGGVASGGR